MQILDQTSFKIFHLHINSQTPWKVLQMRQHMSTGFWYATFACIWSSQLRTFVWKFHFSAVKIALWCIGFLVCLEHWHKMSSFVVVFFFCFFLCVCVFVCCFFVLFFQKNNNLVVSTLRVNPFNLADQKRYLCKQCRSWLVMSHLIRIYTEYHSVFEFRLKSIFASVDISKFKDGRVHFRKLGMKGLILKSNNEHDLYYCTCYRSRSQQLSLVACAAIKYRHEVW